MNGTAKPAASSSAKPPPPPPLKKKQQHTLPISVRSREDFSYLQATGFLVAFLTGCFIVNASHFVLLPLKWVNRGLYDASIRWTKRGFATLILLMCQWFAPTKFVITTEGMDESIFEKDPKTGKVTSINLPKKLVIISNHQVYLDWWYLWILTYFMNVSDSVIITLKKSLKWVPLVGWGMQFFDFIFLARSWGADKIPLGGHLTRIGEEAHANDDPLSLIIYPEGTLVSPNTRPVSKKYADKEGIADMRNCLLPRSTGLLFALRTLSPYVPDLHVLDITMGYPGIPPAGYGQSYYTLRSVFLDRVPPPELHIHMRMYQVARDIPIGDAGSAKDGNVGRGAEAKPEETKVFEEWLIRRWREKDDLLETFYRTGRFFSGGEKPVESTAGGEKGKMAGGDAVEIPLEVRSGWDYLQAYCWFLPWIVWYEWRKVKGAIFG
ncbi:hypothetical protein FRC04_008755 [Tulasnella sp. 424]|nr:hypothetical protein FRC04_008755 [Tulasnella sp. 424]KAG8979985.1 hypothetical protein FRC05_007428 [Tulasnella sp. 425]